jgi:hypothetical protein
LKRKNVEEKPQNIPKIHKFKEELFCKIRARKHLFRDVLCCNGKYENKKLLIKLNIGTKY